MLQNRKKTDFVALFMLQMGGYAGIYRYPQYSVYQYDVEGAFDINILCFS